MTTPPDAALLAETSRVVAAVTPQLAGRLLVQLGAAHFQSEPLLLQDAVPIAHLCLRHPGRNPARDLASDESADALRAFVELATHSRRLDAFPKLKAKFWKKLGRSFEFARFYERNVHLAMLQKPKSPRLAVHFGSEHRPVDGISNAIVDTLYELLTTRHGGMQAGQLAGDDRLSTSQVEPIGIGLSFAHCRLDLDSLLHIQSLLDRVAHHPDRQFDIHMLDLSDNAMGTRELAVVANIVRRIKMGVYQIQILRLDKVVPSSASSVEGGDSWKPPVETPGHFLEIVRMVLNAGKLSISGSRVLPSSAQTSQLNQSSSLTSVSFSGNHLCPKYFAALGSALRYGSPVEELLSSFAVREDDSLDNKRECWRWLAFGLFYPRLERFGGACKLHGLGQLVLDADALATFDKTLRNPVAELVFSGRIPPESEGGAVHGLAACTVKSGSRIVIDQRGGSEKLEQFVVISEERTELEALCERADGSVCVVVPGVGIGWVQPEDAENIEREQLATASSSRASAGKYSVSPSWGFCRERDAVFRSVLALIGPQFRSLNLHSSSYLMSYECDALEVVLANCVSLQYLYLRPCLLTKDDSEALVGALNGKLGDRLLSLKVGSYWCDDEFVGKLSRTLSSKIRTPVLQELRLGGTDVEMDGEELATVYELLGVNHVLRVVELNETRTSHLISGSKSVDERVRLENAFEGQWLPSHLPLQCKLAFLSVVTKRQSKSDRTKIRDESLDRWLLSLIFAFAEAGQVRRMVVWNGRNMEYYKLRQDSPTL